jgi:macrolide transport system ATP-binding/permease protein
VTVRYGNVDFFVLASAVTSDYPRIGNWHLTQGTFLPRNDERSLATVVVLGHKVWRTLFPEGADPLRKFVLVNAVPFQVIGVLGEKGAISGDADDDNMIMIPFSTGSQRLFGTPYLSWISALIEDLEKADQTNADVTASLTNKSVT